MNIKEYLDILKDLWTPTNASKIRMAINNALEMMGNNLKENIDRQDNVENQFQDVLDETTGKDVINGPEIIAARNGEANLKARLDKEKSEVTAQLAHIHVNVKQPPLPLIPAKGNGLDDDHPALQAIIDFVYSKGGGTVYLPKGVYRINTKINPKSGVSIKGAGMGKSILMNYGNVGAITWHVGLDSSYNPEISAENPFVNMHFSDFTIDCANSSNDEYSVGNKGMYIHYMRKCSVRRVQIKNSVATGLGIDFLDQTVIDGNVIENCGRGFISPEQTIGASGIGIGNGGLEKENVIITNNIVRNSGQYGIFIEDQAEFAHEPHFTPEGTIIANNIVSGGRNAGIGVRRGGGAIISNNYTYDNAGNGIEVINNSKKVSLVNNISYGNGGKDVYVEEFSEVSTQSKTETFADYNASTPLEDFPFGETVSIVGSANRVGTPNGLTGILKTTKPTVYVAYATQYFRESARTPNERLYFRVGVPITPTTGNWGDWTQIGSSYVIAENDEYNAENTIASFPDKQITENLITGTNTDGTPNGLAGLLITDKSSGQVSVANQIFKEKDTSGNKSPRLYYRNTKADTKNWGEWTRLITSNDTERIDIPNTSGNTVVELENEVNKLKNLLRGLGMLS